VEPPPADEFALTLVTEVEAQLAARTKMLNDANGNLHIMGPIYKSDRRQPSKKMPNQQAYADLASITKASKPDYWRRSTDINSRLRTSRPLP